MFAAPRMLFCVSSAVNQNADVKIDFIPEPLGTSYCPYSFVFSVSLLQKIPSEENDASTLFDEITLDVCDAKFVDKKIITINNI
jgi:hypothetical protein